MRTLVGNISVQTVVEEIAEVGTLSEIFPGARAEKLAPHLNWLAPDAYDPITGQLRFPTQAYVLKTDRHTVVIDTCIGNHKRHASTYPDWHKRSNFKLLKDMEALGVHPESVDYVMCTHLHADHCGWNTRLDNGRWVPSFPNASYVFSRTELAFSEGQLGNRNDYTYADSVLPILEAGQAVVVDNDFQLDDALWLEPAPGHTPGHVAVRMHSRGMNAVMVGDLIHSPVQLPFPDWSSIFDHEPDLARITRRRVLEDLCDSDVVMMTAHFPLPSMVRVISGSDKGFAMKCLR